MKYESNGKGGALWHSMENLLQRGALPIFLLEGLGCLLKRVKSMPKRWRFELSLGLRFLFAMAWLFMSLLWRSTAIDALQCSAVRFVDDNNNLRITE